MTREEVFEVLELLNVKQRFICNFNNYHIAERIKESLGDFLDRCSNRDFKEIISRAFLWDKTPEGAEFWKNIYLNYNKMNTLNITEESAKLAYEKADKNGKELLKNLFKDQLSFSIMDQVKTYEEVYKILQIKHTIPKNQCLRSAAHIKLENIAEALNEGWKPDWHNERQYKYYIKETNKMDFHPDYRCVCPGLGVVYFKDKEITQHVITYFKDILRDLSTYN